MELGTNPVCKVQPSSVQNPTPPPRISSHLLPPISRSTQQSLLSTCNSGNISQLKMLAPGTSLVVQWLRLHALNAGGLSSIPDQGTRSRMLQLRVHMSQLKNPPCHKEQKSQVLQL